MSKTTKFVDKITNIERHTGYTGRYGNPRWWVRFQDNGTFATEVDGSVGYGINNPEYRAGLVEVTLDGRGNVTYLRPLADGAKPAAE